MSVLFCIFAFSGLVAAYAVQKITCDHKVFYVERNLAGVKCSTGIE